MRFRPCIDLRNGKVVQIVGGTLEGAPDALVTNFETERAPADYARMYQADGLAGGHVIATGTPEQVAQVERSYTGQALKQVLAAGRSHAYAGR